MQLPSVLIAVVLSQVISTYGLVTLQTIRDITNVTEECRGRITRKDVDGREEMPLVVGMGGGMEQSVLSAGHGGDEDGEDVEDVSLPLCCLTLATI